MSVPTLRTPLISGKYYHLYNRGNNKEKLFYYEGNYDFFLEKYRKYCSPFVETYCYCLLPNHFHFLIRIKDEEINPRKVSNQFRKLFITYARMINNQESRTGCLVSKNFRRIEINDEKYLKNLVIYIHKNPMYILIENYTTFPLKSIPLIEVKPVALHWQQQHKNDDKHGYKTRDYQAVLPGV